MLEDALQFGLALTTMDHTVFADKNARIRVINGSAPEGTSHTRYDMEPEETNGHYEIYGASFSQVLHDIHSWYAIQMQAHIPGFKFQGPCEWHELVNSSALCLVRERASVQSGRTLRCIDCRSAAFFPKWHPIVRALVRRFPESKRHPGLFDSLFMPMYIIDRMKMDPPLSEAETQKLALLTCEGFRQRELVSIVQ